VTEQQAFVALNRISGMGGITVGRLIDALGSAAAIFEASVGTLQEIEGIGSVRARAFRREFDSARWDDEFERAAEKSVTLVTWAEESYPQLLLKIPDPPLVLYVRGDPAVLDQPGVAVIGTRHPTIYGRETARRFGFQLAGAGYVVVSGLAVGIDSEAHRGALQIEGGLTVAVIGGALDKLYPRENIPLAREIVEKGGAVVSEYPFGRSPDKQTFPMRNRIVSGLSRGVLVIEAPMGSGTLITVDQALEHGRPVMAVPGRIDCEQAKGCHRILRAGAQLVTSLDDVLEEVDGFLPGFYAGRSRTVASLERPAEQAQPPLPPQAPLSEEEERIMRCLSEEGIPVDEVIRLSGLAAAQVNPLLVGLQIRRRLKMLPGGLVMR